MTTELTQNNKQLVWDFWQKLSETRPDNIENIVQSHVHKDIVWNGPHMINQLRGIDALVSGFWRPLMQSFPDIKRNSDIFFGGRYKAQDWVCGTGYFTGIFANDWLGVPATRQEAHIRFGEFCCIQEGKIVEIYIILDLLDVIQQAGFQLLPPSSGAEDVVPAPRTGDGLVLGSQDDLQAEKSFQLVYDMLFKGLNQFDESNLNSMGMAQYWHPEMRWYGPSGIGTCRSLREFEDFHQQPFLEAFPDRKATDQEALIAEGDYVAASGWPGVVAAHTGEYLGCPPTGNKIDMRVMDFWRREGDVLVENWVLIDIIDIFMQFGVDLFAQLRKQVDS